MILFVLAYLAGVLTIVSPCVLPVLPFVFARADRSFARSTLPMLLGMAAAFVAVATLAAVAGGWAVKANQYGRIAAMALLVMFGITLLFPALSDRMTRPLVALGARLSEAAKHGSANRDSVLPSLLLGMATGLLWAPCAGPILGLILTGAALQGASARTSLLLSAYALGAATSLALALLIGGRIFAAMKRSLGASQWIRRALGVAVLVAVGVIAMGIDTGFLTNLSLARTASLEQRLLDRLHPGAGTQGQSLLDLGIMPSLKGAVTWLNSPPLTTQGLRGKVVLVDFWTYSCINCLRTIPYVRAWAAKYKDLGLVVIGVHTPEFAFEKNIDNVKTAISRLQITYPIAIDNNYAIWRAFDNDAWPADYFVDAQGRIREARDGEGYYAESEHLLQQLLVLAGQSHVPTGLVSVNGVGAEASPDFDDVQSPETYIGYHKQANFVSVAGVVKDMPHDYAAAMLQLNQWALSGNWTVSSEYAVLGQSNGGVVYRFHARDLHLVLGPTKDGRPVRFHVTIDGAEPGDNHGTDINAAGDGIVTTQRLYQLIRQHGSIGDHTFEIRFLDAGVQAYSFTFG
jgi:cytochrome c biogenesis protein CcdA/thiol-disulfide isomerase/thioredoxin